MLSWLQIVCSNRTVFVLQFICVWKFVCMRRKHPKSQSLRVFIFQFSHLFVRKNLYINNDQTILFRCHFNHSVTSTVVTNSYLQTNEKRSREFLKLHWSDFHLSSLGGVVMSFPVIPVDTISVWWVFSVMIQTVQVGVMTALVPPGSFISHSTVTAPAVIILIFGGKGITTMIRKSITSRSWKQKMRIWHHFTNIMKLEYLF